MKRAVLDVMSSRRVGCVVLGAALLTLPIAGIACGGRIDASENDGAAPPTALPKRPQKSPPQTTLPDEENEPGSSVCPGDPKLESKDYDARFGGIYRSPYPPTAACTSEEITRFQSNLGSATSFAHVTRGLSTSCAACIVTPSEQAMWGPVVVREDGVEGFANLGACHAFVNESDACGKAVQFDHFCASEACQECSASQTGPCFGAVQKTVCKATHDAIATSCPMLSKSAQQCGSTIVSHVRYLCGPGT